MDDRPRLRALIRRQCADRKAQPADRLIRLVKQGVRLGFAMAGENTTDWDEKTFRLISPRFLSVVAEEEMAPQNETVHRKFGTNGSNLGMNIGEPFVAFASFHARPWPRLGEGRFTAFPA